MSSRILLNLICVNQTSLYNMHNFNFNSPTIASLSLSLNFRFDGLRGEMGEQYNILSVTFGIKTTDLNSNKCRRGNNYTIRNKL